MAANQHQTTMDLLNISASVSNIDAAITACAGAGDCANNLDIDESRVYFLTHSLTGNGAAGFPISTTKRSTRAMITFRKLKLLPS